MSKDDNLILDDNGAVVIPHQKQKKPFVFNVNDNIYKRIFKAIGFRRVLKYTRFNDIDQCSNCTCVYQLLERKKKKNLAVNIR